MNTRTARQDFEEYARSKPQLGAIAESWLRAFQGDVLPRIQALPDRRALDYGFGDGRFFDVLSEQFGAANVHGVEVSETRATRARVRGWTNARTLPAGERLPYPDGHFAFVNMVEVIEHIPAAVADGILADLARVLSPGGALLLTTPNYPIKRLYDVLDAVKLRRWSRLRDDPTHVSLYGHRALRDVLTPHFGQITFGVFKAGLFYTRLGRESLCHKILALCTAPVAPQGAR